MDTKKKVLDKKEKPEMSIQELISLIISTHGG